MVTFAIARRIGGAAVIVITFGSIASCGGNAPQSSGGGHPMAGGSTSEPGTPSGSSSPSGNAVSPGSSASGGSSGLGGQSGQPGGQPTGQPSDQPTSSPSNWPTIWPSTSPSYQPPPVPYVRACATADLSGSVRTRGGLAGSNNYYSIVVKNVSASACTLYGYPGVALVATTSGPQVGHEADWDPSVPELITLKPGDLASATLRAANVSPYPPAQCRAKSASFLQVIPPGQRAPFYLSLRLETCTGQITGDRATIGVEPFQPGVAG